MRATVKDTLDAKKLKMQVSTAPTSWGVIQTCFITFLEAGKNAIITYIPWKRRFSVADNKQNEKRRHLKDIIAPDSSASNLEKYLKY